MARRRLLTDEQWAGLLALPNEERDVVRHCTLGPDELAVLAAKRAPHNRLGYALLLCAMRHPGRMLDPGEIPPPPMLAYVARQVGAEPSDLRDYSGRGQTRREQIAELMRRHGLRVFGRAEARIMLAWLTPIAQINRKPIHLVSVLLDELRRRRILLPPPLVLERLVHHARLQAERITHRALTDGMEAEQIMALDGILAAGADGGPSQMAWLRQAPASPASKNLLGLIERIKTVRALPVDRNREAAIPAAAFDALAAEGLRMTAQHLRDLVQPRRSATLVAAVIRLETELTDSALLMFDKLMGGLFRKAERRTAGKTAEILRDALGQLRLLVKASRAVIAAHEHDADPVAAVEQAVGWVPFLGAVAKAETLARPETVDVRAELVQRWPALRAEGPLPVGVADDVASHLAARQAALAAIMADVAAQAEAGTLQDAALVDGELKITPLKAAEPPEVGPLARAAYDLLPRVKITDLLLEVDGWTGFSDCFTHARSGRPADDRPGLLTAVLADGINLGLTRMAEACRGTTLRQLAWTHDWHVREDCYAAALARIVDAHRALPLARVWGDGSTSSSDGQFFRAGGRGEALGDINARHGNEPGVAFYTHVSDQFGPFHTKVIAATASEAPHVLDGLLQHQSGLRIAEHYTDTGGATDQVFGLFALLGYRFAPRLRDLKDRRLYAFRDQDVPAALAGLVGGTIDTPHLAAHWDEALRLAVSVGSGHATASDMLRRLAAYPRQNGLAVALRELGRIERTLFTLDWIRDPGLRRRANAGLNKGEARNALARAVFFHRLGELRDRSFDNQIYRASGLNLLVAAIILWNTRYLQAAFDALAASGTVVPSELVRHVAPLGWEHISLTGDYIWAESAQLTPDRLRPLRERFSLLAA